MELDSESRVLVVEDEPLVRRLLGMVLEEVVSKVDMAATVAEANRILSSEHIDLVVTDGTLPDGSGSALARNVRATQPEVRLLLVSGAHEDTHEFDAVLAKPFTREALLRVVKHLLMPPA